MHNVSVARTLSVLLQCCVLLIELLPTMNKMYTRVRHAHGVSQTHISNTRSQSKNQIKYSAYLYIRFYALKRSLCQDARDRTKWWRTTMRMGQKLHTASCIVPTVRTGFKFSHGWMISVKIKWWKPRRRWVRMVRWHSMWMRLAIDYSSWKFLGSLAGVFLARYLHDTNIAGIFFPDLIALDNCISTQCARSMSNKEPN